MLPQIVSVEIYFSLRRTWEEPDKQFFSGSYQVLISFLGSYQVLIRFLSGSYQLLRFLSGSYQVLIAEKNPRRTWEEVLLRFLSEKKTVVSGMLVSGDVYHSPILFTWYAFPLWKLTLQVSRSTVPESFKIGVPGSITWVSFFAKKDTRNISYL